MTLITRQGKGSKLTIEEMDSNLTYLNGSYKKTILANIDWSEATTQEYTLDGDVTFTFTEALEGQKLILLLDVQESGTITWPESVKWTASITPNFTSEVIIDETFVTGNGFNSFINTLAIQSDGKILAGGGFDGYGFENIGYGIARLNPDGSLDETFLTGTGFNNSVSFTTVFNITVQSDGKILVAGVFDKYDEQSVGYGIARLNQDGSNDEMFGTGSGFTFSEFPEITDVKATAVQTDGKIICVGYFDTYNGQNIGNGIVRLNQNGTIDETFITGSGFNNINSIRTIDIQSDGKILVGGGFSSYDGQEVGIGIVRLNQDGTLDETFITGNGFNDDVRKITIQSDGKILVIGNFDGYDGQSTAFNIARLNQDGTLDETFITGNGFNDDVRKITIQSDGKILVGGEFTSFGGKTVNRIARLNQNGSLDETFITGSGFNDDVNTIIIQSDGKILVEGQFDTYKGKSYPSGLVRLEKKPVYKVIEFCFNGEYFIGSAPINQL